MKKMLIKTKHLVLKPLKNDQIAELAEKNANDANLHKAYLEMLEDSQNHPEERQWFAPWGIFLPDGKLIGDAGFKGTPINGAVEIGYGIDEIYRNRGYATEAAMALRDWAFEQKNVFFFEAEAEETNIPSLRVIHHLGLQKYAQGNEGPRFVSEKPFPHWTPFYFFLGMILSIPIGMIYQNWLIAFLIGGAAGLIFGLALDLPETIRHKKAAKARVQAKK